MCGYFCIRFIDFMLKCKNLLGYINLFFPNKYEKNDKIILKYFQYIRRLRWKNLFVENIGNFKTLKISYILEKTVVLPIICSKCQNEDEKIFKE